MISWLFAQLTSTGAADTTFATRGFYIGSSTTAFGVSSGVGRQRRYSVIQY